MHDDDDVSSNPLNDDHLPVGGETGDEEEDLAPDITDDYTSAHDDEDTGLSPDLDDEDEDDLAVSDDTELDDEDDESIGQRL